MKTLVLFIICFFVACSTPQPTAVDSGPHGPTPYAPDASATTGMAVPRSVFMLHRPIARPQPPQPDTRSPSEIAQAACLGPQGWRCPKLARKTILAASGNQPIIPTSWTVPNWYIDPANSSGCASDANSGTSGTCGAAGIGPLVTWNELNTHRWGCFGSPTACPRLRQITTVTWVTSGTATDVVYAAPGLENSGQLILTGTPTTVCSGSLSNFSARTSSALVRAQVGACSPSAGQLAVNTTHASSAWVYSLSSGSIWNFSQPLARETPATWNGVDPSEITWANGDNVTLYTLPQVMISYVDGKVSDASGGTGTNAGTWITQLDMTGALSVAALATIRGTVFLADTKIDSFPTYTSLTGAIIPYWFNVYTTTSVEVSHTDDGAHDLVWFAGVFAPAFATSTTAIFQSGLIVGGGVSVSMVYGGLGDVYVDTGTTLVAIGATEVFTALGGPTAAVSGPGTLAAWGSSVMTYPTGAGQASALFKMSALKIGNQTNACAIIPSSTSAPVCNLAATPTQMDATLGATAGCFTAGGASVCNTGGL